MTTATARSASGAVRTKSFYFLMSLAMFATAFIGFAPTYFAPMLKGVAMPPILHMHAIVLFTWCGLFCAQTWRVAKGDIAGHRNWGMFGICVATLIATTVIALVAARTAKAAATGDPAIIDGSNAFSWVQVSSLLYFVPVFALAIINVKRPETHKRLMMLASISMLGAPIARVFMVLFAPPGALGGPSPVSPPVEVVLIPALVSNLFLLAAVYFDWKTQKKIHPVYLIGGAILIALEGSIALVAHSPAWMAIAPLLGRLGG